MLQRLQSYVEELRKPENLFTILGVFVSLILAVLGVLGGNNTTTLAGIVAVLETLAISQILTNIRVTVQSDRMETVTATLSRIEKAQRSLGIVHGRDRLLSTRQQIEKAQNKALMLGTTFHRTLGIRMRHLLLEKIQSGCEFKIMLLNPEPESGMMVASEMSYEYEGDVDTYKRHIEETLDNLSYLYSKAEPGQIQVRLLDANPRYGLLITDSDDRGAETARVEFYLYKLAPDVRPNLYFSQQDDPEWFGIFEKQFEKMWGDATPWEPQ